MRVLVIQFLLGMFKSSKEHAMLSTNPRSTAVRELFKQYPQHEFVLLSINKDFKAERVSGRPTIVFYDVPPTRMLWLLYLLLFSLLVRPRIAICFGMENTSVATVASVLTRSKVLSVIGSDIDYLDRQYRLPRQFELLTRMILRWSLGGASQVFVPNQRVMESVRRLTGRQVGISQFKYKVSDIFAPPTARKRDFTRNPLILTVARLGPVKGLEYLVMAAKEVLKSFPEATFLIQSAYQDPSYQSHLEKLMIREGVRDHFRFSTGPIPNSEMPKLYNSADLFVLPSLSEGRNSAILEALACGLPVVVTNVGANNEVVVDMKNGFVVEPKDASAIAVRIIQILKDNDLWHNLSDAARSTSAWSQEYDLGTMLKEATSSIERAGTNRNLIRKLK